MVRGSKLDGCGEKANELEAALNAAATSIATSHKLASDEIAVGDTIGELDTITRYISALHDAWKEKTAAKKPIVSGIAPKSPLSVVDTLIKSIKEMVGSEKIFAEILQGNHGIDIEKVGAAVASLNTSPSPSR